MQEKKSSSNSSSQFSIQIPNWTNENGVVHYNIHFQNTRTGVSWGLKQRYSGLAQLHDETTKFLKLNKDIDIQLPTFPSKKWWVSQDSAFLAERKTLLQEYLQTLFSQSEITSVNPIADALLQPNKLITYNSDDCNVEGLLEEQDNYCKLDKDQFNLLKGQDNILIGSNQINDFAFKQNIIEKTQFLRQNHIHHGKDYVEKNISLQKDQKQLKFNESSTDYQVQHEQYICDPIFSPQTEAISAIKRIGDEICPSFDSMNNSPGLRTYMNYCFPAASPLSSGFVQNNVERSNGVENDDLYEARYIGAQHSTLVKVQEEFNSAKMQYKKAVKSIHEENEISSFIETGIFQVETSVSSNYSRLGQSNSQSQSLPSIIEQSPEEKENEVDQKLDNLVIQEKLV